MDRDYGGVIDCPASNTVCCDCSGHGSCVNSACVCTKGFQGWRFDSAFAHTCRRSVWRWSVEYHWQNGQSVVVEQSSIQLAALWTCQSDSHRRPQRFVWRGHNRTKHGHHSCDCHYFAPRHYFGGDRSCSCLAASTCSCVINYYFNETQKKKIAPSSHPIPVNWFCWHFVVAHESNSFKRARVSSVQREWVFV